MQTKFRRKVKHGSKTGQKIGFPTINLNVGQFGKYVQKGVYQCQVFVDNKLYKSVLYFGQKMHHKEDCLEIYILNFNRQIYGKWISFKLGKRIRGPKKFEDLNYLKKQIKKDLQSMI